MQMDEDLICTGSNYISNNNNNKNNNNESMDPDDESGEVVVQEIKSVR